MGHGGGAEGAFLIDGLTKLVVAPAVGRAAGCQGAGVFPSSAHQGKGAGLVGVLAVPVVAPAVDRAGGLQDVYKRQTQTMPLAIYLGFEMELGVAVGLSVILVGVSFLVLVGIKVGLGQNLSLIHI